LFLFLFLCFCFCFCFLFFFVCFFGFSFFFYLFTFIGKEHFIKYWWFTHQGVASLETEEQVKNITNADHATLDLFTSIGAGDFPSWTLKVQILDPADADEVRREEVD
jgi:catalase